MSNPNPTQHEVKTSLNLDIMDLRMEIERMIGMAENLAEDIRSDFGQGSARVAKRIDDCIASLNEAHGDIDSAYNEATGGS